MKRQVELPHGGERTIPSRITPCRPLPTGAVGLRLPSIRVNARHSLAVLRLVS